jgi:hypothetical protein
MVLGYIISEEKIEVENFINLNSLIDIDDELPRLIVGREFGKTLGLKPSILNKKMSKYSYWTYSPTEKKSEYTDDLELFKKISIDLFLNKVKYFYIDPFNLTLTQIKRLITKVNGVTNGLIYYDNKMCYVFYDSMTYGINWDVMEYLGIEKQRLIKYLKDKNFKILLKDEIFNKCMFETNNIKVLPYLHYLKTYDQQDLISVLHNT